MAGLLSGCSAIDALQPRAVVDIIRTIDNKANITTQDYDQLEDISALMFQQIRDIDPQIHPPTPTVIPDTLHRRDPRANGERLRT